jgi:hypothetical protein
VTSDLACSRPLTVAFSSPFVQRVWVALEAKGLQYQYIEVDPYKKPQSLLDVNPRGLVPGLRHGDWGCGESSVLMEYVCFVGLQQMNHLLTILIARRSRCRAATPTARQP